MTSAQVAVVVVCLFAGVSFFFALAETALFSLSKWQAQHLAEAEPERGGIVQRLLGEPQNLLATMVLGNTFATAAMLSTALWMALHGTWPWWGTVAGLLGVILFGCEVLPKTMGVRAPDRWALRLARPLLVIERVSAPLRRVAQGINNAVLRRAVPASVRPQTAITEADYQELLDWAYQHGALAESEKEIILQILHLDRRTVKEVMKPRSQVSAISDDLSVEEMVVAAREHRHRRLPIYDETLDTIIGVLNTRLLLLDPQRQLEDAVEMPSFVPETMNLLQLLKSLQRQQRGLAIVLDEFGGTAGIITLDDILEEMVGRMRRESGETKLVMEKLGPSRWRLSGTMRLDDFRREYPALGDLTEVETIGGLFLLLNEVVPNPGDTVVFRGLKLTAQVTDERRVREVIAEVK